MILFLKCERGGEIYGGKHRRDLVVVGSGLTGCEIAAGCRAYGMDLLVIEAGPYRGSGHIAAEAATRSVEQRTADPDFCAFLDPAKDAASTGGYRRRVGGRGLYWRGIVVPIEPDALLDWPAPVREALLGSADRPGSYAAMAQFLDDWIAETGVDGHRNLTEERLVAELQALGVPARPTPRAVRHLPGGSWEAYSALTRVPADRVVPNRPVVDIMPLDDGGYRVCCEGGWFIETRAVVLAAGAYAVIALADRLLPAPSRPSAYAVVDHIASGAVHFEPSQVRPSAEASAFLGFRPDAGSNMFVEATADDGGVLHDVWAMAEQPPQYPAALQVEGGGLRLRLDRPAVAAIEDVQLPNAKRSWS